MKRLVPEELRELVAHRAGPCVSIYMPMHRGQDNKQDPIRFKNLLGRCREYLLASGMRPAQVQELLDPLYRTSFQPETWRNPAASLAVFCAPGLFRQYRLETEVPEAAIVAEQFHLKPMIEMLTGLGTFYVLALNLNHVGFYRCSRLGIEPVTIPDSPMSLAESMKFDVIEESARFHTVSAPSARPMGVWSGPGNGGNDERVRKKFILEFFLKLDRSLCRMLASQRTPLVLAGVKYLCSLYREANRYGGLIEQEVSGSTDRMDVKKLHQQSLLAIEPLHGRRREQAVAKYHQLAGTPMASSDLKRIVSAAYQGQVQTLLVPLGANRWGSYDPATDNMLIHDKQQAGEEDLLDFAAAHTLMHGGDLYTVPAGPQSAPAAVLRYGVKTPA